MEKTYRLGLVGLVLAGTAMFGGSPRETSAADAEINNAIDRIGGAAAEALSNIERSQGNSEKAAGYRALSNIFRDTARINYDSSQREKDRQALLGAARIRAGGERDAARIGADGNNQVGQVERDAKENIPARTSSPEEPISYYVETKNERGELVQRKVDESSGIPWLIRVQKEFERQTGKELTFSKLLKYESYVIMDKAGIIYAEVDEGVRRDYRGAKQILTIGDVIKQHRSKDAVQEPTAPKITTLKDLASAEDRISTIERNGDKEVTVYANNRALGRYRIDKKFEFNEKISTDDIFVKTEAETGIPINIFKNKEYGYYMIRQQE